MTEDRASAEDTAQLRAQLLVGRTLLRQALAHLSELTGGPHGRLPRTALAMSAGYIGSAVQLLDALDDVLDPSRLAGGGALAVLHLQQRVVRDPCRPVGTTDMGPLRGEAPAGVRRR